MKKINGVLALLVCVCLMFSAQAQSDSASAPGNNPNAPEIKFEKLVHDYGTIEKNANGDCEFKFTNNGKEPLVLTDCRASCGCTVPTCPKEPILPGQSSTIKVKYATSRVGPINKKITINSNAKNSPVVLTITGKVNAPPVNNGIDMPENEAVK